MANARLDMLDAFAGPFSELYDDDLSTETTAFETEVFDDDSRKVGEVCRHSLGGRDTSWAARDAQHARYGDVPGRPTGWVRGFRGRDEAEATLRELARRSAS